MFDETSPPRRAAAALPGAVSTAAPTASAGRGIADRTVRIAQLADPGGKGGGAPVPQRRAASVP